MNRPIVFRVKSREDGEWCHFFFGIERPQGSQAHDTWIPLMAGFHPFDPGLYDLSTLGQWPGIRDSNGRMIFEGDKLLWTGDEYVVEWFDKRAGFAPVIPTYFRGERDGSLFNATSLIVGGSLDDQQWQNMLVVGNIHDDESDDEEVKG